MRGGLLRDRGLYKLAEPLIGEALALAEEAFENDSLEVATIFNLLGMFGSTTATSTRPKPPRSPAGAFPSSRRRSMRSHLKLMICLENHYLLLPKMIREKRGNQPQMNAD